MTIEAEALGSDVDYGSLKCEPKIQHEPFLNAADVRRLPSGAILKNKRAEGLLKAVNDLSKSDPDVPVVGSITGPVSLAASLVDPMSFFKGLRKDKEASHKLLDYVTERLIEYAKCIAECGAAVVSIADPTATGEILGPALFEEYALPCLNRIAESMGAMGTPVIIHICGDVRTIKKHFPALKGNAVSVDAMVNLQALKSEYSSLTTMGNLSTYMLEFSTVEKIYRATENLLQHNIDIISPACGLSTSTPLANIGAFTGAVKGA
jgi:[methyl-Co(III) methanol-specific corrinoid protein]:coenzyme M methyltransferase